MFIEAAVQLSKVAIEPKLLVTLPAVEIADVYSVLTYTETLRISVGTILWIE